MSSTGALVYVVDDDQSAREGVASLIRSAGLMAKTFASGEEFLATPRPKLPSCLVLDVNLPGLNGLDLQQELAKTDFQVPIIFLIMYGSGERGVGGAPRPAYPKETQFCHRRAAGPLPPCLKAPPRATLSVDAVVVRPPDGCVLSRLAAQRLPHRSWGDHAGKRLGTGCRFPRSDDHPFAHGSAAV